MADQADDRCVRDQCKVLTGLKLPGFNWKANNMRMEFDIFWQTLKFVLEGMEIPEEKWYLYILQQLGREGMELWNTSIEASVNKNDPHAIIKAFKKGYKLEETYWMYRSLYLSSEKQGRGESAATLATRVEDLVSMCKWLDNQKEQRCIDLFYHLAEVFDVRRFVQIETSREGGNLTWEKLVEEAKVKNMSARSMPSSGERTVAVAHHPTEIQPWPQTPYPGGTTSLSRDHRHHLEAKEARARSSAIGAEDNGCTGERETCPAWGKECGICKGQSVGRPLRCKQEEAPSPSSRSKGKANLLARMEKQRPNTLAPLCLRWYHQQRG